MIALGEGLQENGMNPQIFVSSASSQTQIQILKMSRVPFQIRNFKLLDGDEVDGPYTERLSSNETRSLLRPSEISRFSAIVSDTLVWPSRYSGNALFIGQFTWDQYRNCGNPDCSGYSLDELNCYKSIIGIDLFAWNPIRLHPRYFGLPLIDYWNLRQQEIRYLDQLGMAFNGTELKPSIPYPSLKQIAHIRGIPEFVDKYRVIPRIIVTRAGIGNTMEVLSVGSRLVLTEGGNTIDTKYNREVLISRGLAIGEDQLLDEITSGREFVRILPPPMYTKQEFAEEVIRLARY